MPLRAALLTVCFLVAPSGVAAAGFGPVDRLPVPGRVLSGMPDGGAVMADDGRLRGYDGGWARTFDLPLGDVMDAAVTPDELIYAADPVADVVRVLAGDGRQVGTLGADVLDAPRLVAAARDGGVAVADRAGVTRFAIDGSVLTRIPLAAEPADLALDAPGTVYTVGPRGRIVADPLPGRPRTVRGLAAAAIAVDDHDRVWVSDAGGGGLVRLNAGAHRRVLVCPSVVAVSLAGAGDRLIADETVLGADSGEPCGPARIALRGVTLTRTRFAGVRVGFRLREAAFVRVQIVRPHLAVHAIGRLLPRGRRHISLNSVTNRAGEEQLLHNRVTVRVHAELGLRLSRTVTRSLAPG